MQESSDERLAITTDWKRVGGHINSAEAGIHKPHDRRDPLHYTFNQRPYSNRETLHLNEQRRLWLSKFRPPFPSVKLWQGVSWGSIPSGWLERCDQLQRIHWFFYDQDSWVHFKAFMRRANSSKECSIQECKNFRGLIVFRRYYWRSTVTQSHSGPYSKTWLRCLSK